MQDLQLFQAFLKLRDTAHRALFGEARYLLSMVATVEVSNSEKLSKHKDKESFQINDRHRWVGYFSVRGITHSILE